MQTIKHTYENIHPVFDALERYYAYASTTNHAEELVRPIFDSSFADLCQTFHEHVGVPMPTFKNRNYDVLNLPEYDKNTVIVCFSGGKDSIAVTLKLKQLGYKIYLYYANHANPSLSDEVRWAKEAAQLLGLPIYIDDIHYSGHNDYMEHPMKNMMIANGALHYGIKNNLTTRLVFGNYTSSVLDNNVFDRCAGDCMDMWRKYDSIISKIIPGFAVESYLLHMGETLSLVTKDRALLDVSLSCLCRHSLRPYRHNWVLEKFGIDLPKNRCGSCYKCCMEYIYMADHDLIEYSEDYYKYCLTQLRKVCKAENTSVYSIMDLWDMYCFYSPEQSKLGSGLYDALITKGGIRWVTTESTTSASS